MQDLRNKTDEIVVKKKEREGRKPGGAQIYRTEKMEGPRWGVI